MSWQNERTREAGACDRFASVVALPVGGKQNE